MPNPWRCSGDASATPVHIWTTCFDNGWKWELWEPDLVGVRDPSGGMASGTTLTFVNKRGTKYVPCKISDVVPNESFTFAGGSAVAGFVGKVKLTPKDSTTTTIEYSFQMTGCLGAVMGGCCSSCLLKPATEEGLHNLVALSEKEPEASSNRVPLQV